MQFCSSLTGMCMHICTHAVLWPQFPLLDSFGRLIAALDSDLNSVCSALLHHHAKHSGCAAAAAGSLKGVTNQSRAPTLRLFPSESRNSDLLNVYEPCFPLIGTPMSNSSLAPSLGIFFSVLGLRLSRTQLEWQRR